jgi:hypothetical protein
MRWTMIAVAFVLSFAGLPGATFGKQPAAAKPKQQCVVFCRQFDEKGGCFTMTDHTLGSGESATVMPKVEIAIRDIKPSNGATIDVTIERPTGPAIHVVKFAKFNETQTIPLGDKGVNGAKPRLEVLIGAGDVVRLDWTWDRGKRSPEDAAREEVFEILGDTGTSRILCMGHSRLPVLIGDNAYQALDCGLDCVQNYFEFANLYCSICPHRFGLTDMVNASGPILSEWFWMKRESYERAWFGSVAHYDVELLAGPTLIQNLETLKRLPKQSNVTIRIHCKTPKGLGAGLSREAREYPIPAEMLTDQQLQTALDTRQAQAVKDFHAFNVFLTATEAKSFWHTAEEHAEDKGPNHNDSIKTVTVNWQTADAAIPDFKKLANLEQVLIYTAAKHEKNAKTKEALKTLQKALPTADVHLVFYGKDEQQKVPAQKTASRDKAETENARPNSGSVSVR